MHQITSSQFKQAIELDPAWASKLEEPVEITDFCDMRGSDITHLSPLLQFGSRDTTGNSATFSGCKSLKTAEGKFAGYADFSDSGIEKIGDLACGRNYRGMRFAVTGCKNLRNIGANFNPEEVHADTDTLAQLNKLAKSTADRMTIMHIEAPTEKDKQIRSAQAKALEPTKTKKAPQIPVDISIV